MYTRIITGYSTNTNEISLTTSKKLSRERLLNAIDKIWRNGELFQNKPTRKFINSLVNYVTLDHGNSLPLSQRSQNTFSEEFYKLSNHTDFGDTRKAIMLTQALELALLGVDSTPILKKINQNKILDKDNTRGYRQELLAAWFVAKFVYDLKNNPQNFTVQARIGDKEVDIVTDDAFVSVKDHKADNSQGEQIRHLFLIMLNANLPINIQKIILIKATEDAKKYNPQFRHLPEHRLRLNCSIEAERDFLFNEQGIDDKYLALYDGLQISLLYTPPPDELEDLNQWIMENCNLTDTLPNLTVASRLS